MTRLYVAQPYLVGDTIILPEEAAHHWCRVLRASVGDTAQLFDGQGHMAEVRLVEAGRKQALVEVLATSRPVRESPLRSHLGLVMSRGERLDYALQKATELGVTEISLLSSERCEVKLRGDDRADKKIGHWQRVLVSACEQSGRNSLPTLYAPMPLADWLKQVSCSHKWVLAPNCQGGGPSPSVNVQDCALLIGPEGGLSDTEIYLAQQHGFMPWQLGPRILRTETAPVAALSLLQFFYGDFN
jgi:16S rRNA (uracil1498-N3)-methyltransferase